MYVQFEQVRSRRTSSVRFSVRSGHKIRTEKNKNQHENKSDEDEETRLIFFVVSTLSFIPFPTGLLP